MMFQYHLTISELLLRIESPRKLTLSHCFHPFLVSNEEGKTPDIVLDISFGDGYFGDCCWGTAVAGNVCFREDGLIQRYCWKGSEYIYRAEKECGRDHIPCRIFIPESFADTFCRNGNLLNYMALERMMLPFDRVFLHASAVIHHGKAYLFSAPSGGGKSTHAALWKQYGDAELINGDKALIAVHENGCSAYGSPVAGSSEIYQNLGAPLAAIIFLKKGKENHAEILDGHNGYLNIYSELVKCSWDKNYNCRLLDLTERIVQEIPLLSFECTPNPEAFEYILGFLKRKEI